MAFAARPAAPKGFSPHSLTENSRHPLDTRSTPIPLVGLTSHSWEVLNNEFEKVTLIPVVRAPSASGRSASPVFQGLGDLDCVQRCALPQVVTRDEEGQAAPVVAAAVFADPPDE